MLLVKYLLLALSAILFAGAALVLFRDLYPRISKWREENQAGIPPIRWRIACKLARLSLLPFLLALGISVIPNGMAGVRVSQISGPIPGTLYPGIHWINPLLHKVCSRTSKIYHDSVRSELCRDRMDAPGGGSTQGFGVPPSGAPKTS